VTGRGLGALLLAAIVVAAAGTALHFATTTRVAGVGSPQASTRRAVSALSLPLFFEPNQGQTDPQVRFLARGAGYSLFLTGNEAVLELQQSAVGRRPSAVGPQPSVVSPQLSTNNVIRMRLDGANSSARVSGGELLRGKSNYFIGNDPAKWHRNIPQFARVNYAGVYPGVDLVYYGNQGQLEYDFRVAPGADPGQIVLNFDGASARLDSGNLVLSTGQGDLLFHAPRIYQQEGNTRKAIAGSFRQLAGNKIGFALGAYDRSRELVIDPTLSYSTYLGPGGGAVGESAVQVAVDSGLNIYVAGSTTSTNFPVVNPIQSTLKGAQNIFIAKINPFATGLNQLLFATYLGGSGTDTAAGVAVDGSGSIYVAGSTTSPDFPTTPSAFQQPPLAVAGTHGFLSKLSLLLGSYTLNYSTYLAGNVANGSSTGDTVTGLAIDGSQDAFVTGTTTSTDLPSQSVGFPANLNGYQQKSNGGTSQFFASKINTAGSGLSSMLYSTYFGGGNPVAAQTVGGGIAVDTGGNMYFTGGMNFQGIGTTPFPLLNAQQTCLNEPGKNSNCTNPDPGNLDAFVAKINPNVVGTAGLVFSTFLGGSDNDVGLAVAVDTASNPYVTGETFSSNWNVPPSPAPAPFQSAYGTNGDAFIVKLGPLNSSGFYPIGYFTYLGGTGEDIGRAIAADSVQGAHVTGSTNSTDLTVYDELDKQPNGYGGGGDAFVALILTTFSGRPLPNAPFNGDYLTYLGGNDFDQGTGIAIDSNNATYVAGETRSGPSGPFPTVNPYQGQLNGTQDAFASKISALSSFAYASAPTVSPNPADMGVSVTFTFTFINNGPEAASNVFFSGGLTGTSQGQGFTFTSASASPGGSCPAPVGGVLTCQIGTVAAGDDATVSIVLVPTCSSPSTCATELTVTPTLSANGGGFITPQCSFPPPQFCSASASVIDFSAAAAPSSQTVVAGNPTSYTVTLAPVPSNQTYASSISMSFSFLPPGPQGTTGTWTTNPVTIAGGGSTTLNITTTARPVQTGSLQHGGPLYATWLPVAGLSLLGLGLGAGWKRRRWLAGAVVGLIVGIILLQPACGSSSSSTTPGGGTQAGTYQLTITASSGSDTHTANVTLIVQ